MTGYFLHSFGCRASAADGDAIAVTLETEGGLRPASMETAEVVVVNTCAVTAEAERSARAMIRRVRRANPGARVVVTGCYAQRAPEELRMLPGVDAVVGNSHKSSVAAIALEPNPAPAQEAGFVPASALLHAPFRHAWFAGEHAHPSALPLAPVSAMRTRPILKVQDGCGNRCSFCVIPETRGPSRSVSIEEAVRAAGEFTATGGQELVLSGINLGRWGRDLHPARTLPELVRALLEQTSLPRLRISSVEPMDWSSELLTLYAEYARGGAHPRLAPHAHLPLQSGADAILRRMHRRYRPWHYAEKLASLRQLLPDASLGADIMVGFPGETDTLFRESYDFIAAQPLTYLHLFPFSPRPGTAAELWHRERPVAPAAVRERMKTLESLVKKKRQAFRQPFAGQSLSAVTLRDGTALTANFLPIRLTNPAPSNRLALVTLASMEEDELLGTVLQIAGEASANG